MTMTSNMLEAALSYAARGWHVGPAHVHKGGSCSCSKGGACPSKAKHPSTPNGFYDASTDTETNRR